ncbi:1,4-alpha-glucan branching protein GlgB [Halalkalibacter hemicellulosilyticus]|uniref:1,4-alpha-glucan branching enzyme GlgB n=1 Tax=Halalkalibacter hemicellulosilyticusJCM 9152 TaxID=1236971 RepID=W4QFP3_9BACI|nr:1,4-alpha-glucan branching protein GlgB [Halalkalibacter hemicellulosilyticus]GAE30453.1 1,4-alpha-glucan (glycogen) branching enzyme [Halalkalibacter hemicellulosilyticusJCM 9152]
MNEFITEHDIYLFHQGTHYFSYQFLGSHSATVDFKKGYFFTVWAPNASEVRVVGDFNKWDGSHFKLDKISNQGLWHRFFPSIPAGSSYKYEIHSGSDIPFLKADPYAFQSEIRPATASVLTTDSTFQWDDTQWRRSQKETNPLKMPINIYEVHIGSWRTHADGTLYSYKELAKELIPYVKSLGYTHIELLPLGEHPFDLSWGYQQTGYYSVTSRYGHPNDLKYFINECHLNELGVILDWVPGHFCKDDHGLRLFDGTPIYEYADPRKAEKRNWGTLTFDFGRPEVQSFLISNALYWLKEFHFDGLRVDAVASMLYLNFDNYDGEEKLYNSYGGEENLEAAAFLRKLNEVVFDYKPHTLMMAEDSTDIPLITSPTYAGGLGFNFKWNMGWMNDTLDFMERDPVYRKWHHQCLTFPIMYTYSENFLLPLSHDEVVHGKKSLLNKMPGDQWQQFANLRLLYGYMMTHPGKKLLFMGGELGLYSEWKDKEQLDWHLIDYPLHKAMFDFVKDLNHFYKHEPSLFECDHKVHGFEWIDPHNIDQSIIVFLRRGDLAGEELIIVCNFTPNVYYDYKVGVPYPGTYKEVFNSDADKYGGSNQLNVGRYFSFPEKWHGHNQHIKIKIPPLAISVFSTPTKGVST